MRGAALQRVREAFEARGESVEDTTKGFLARCPVHENANSTPSLHVDQGDKGALFQCRSANCSHESIVAALGLRSTQLFDDEPKGAKAREKRGRDGWETLDLALSWWKEQNPELRDVVAFIYRDAKAAEAFAVLRGEGGPKGKEFSQLQRSRGRWGFGAPRDKRSLYRLPELLAADPSEPVLLVEGEKKVELLHRLGFVATTSAQGARGAKASDWSALRSRRIVALPDNDEAGFAYVEQAREFATKAGAKCFAVVNLDGLRESEDVVDWAEQRSEQESKSKLAAFIEKAIGEAREEEEQHGTSWRELSLDELLAQPPVEWLAKGLLPLRGVALLASEPRAGKSFLALDLAMRVVCGSSSFLERPVKADGGVVYAALEGVAGLAARARAWRKANPNESAQRPLHLLRWRGEALLTDGCEEFADELRKCVRKSGRVSLVIVDTLTLALAADENDSASVGKALRFLSDLADELGCCILVVHHVRKEGKALGQARARMSLSDVRGSSALVGNVDVVLGLEFQEGRAERALLVLKSKDGEAGSPLWFQLDVIETGIVLEDRSLETSCAVRACGAPAFVEPDAEELREQREERKRQRDEQRAEELRECVVEAACELLRKHPHGLPKTAIVKRLKGRKASLLLILDEALGEGRFVQARKGNGFVFQLPPPLKPETEQKLDEHGLAASEGAEVPEFPEVPESSRNLREPNGDRDEAERERGSRVPGTGGCGGNTHTHATAPQGGDA